MEREWRCARCGKLLAVVRGERLHIRIGRGHEYLVGFPVTSACRSCGTLNEIRGATSKSSPAKGGAATITD